MRVYSERYGNVSRGTGELVVRTTPKGQHELVGYVPPGVDLTPMVFCRGSLDDCRKEYNNAAAWMRYAVGPKV